MKRIFLSTIAASLLFAVSCQNDFENSTKDVVITSGEANFSKYISLGNSLTSGYRDGALYINGQNESYPSMIAQQMKLAGGGEFKQPMMPNNVGGFIGIPGFSGKLVLNENLLPVPLDAAAPLDNISSNGPYQNMGVPGAKSFHLIAPGYGNLENLPINAANPYFVRFASSPSTTVLADAKAQQPSFFSLWIGANDVLAYSLAGGTNSQTSGNVTTYFPATDQTGNPNPTDYKANDISDPNLVAGSIKEILDGLNSVGATKGVIANIPDVTSIPFFTKIPYNAIPLDIAQAQTLNTSLYGPLHAVLGDRITSVSAGNNPVLIVDNSLTSLATQLTAAFVQFGFPQQQADFLGQAFGQARQATPEDLVLLTASSVFDIDALTGQPATATSQFVYGRSFPVPDQLSLTKTEVSKIQAATTAYNTAIANLADTYGLAFVDANKKMKELNSTSGILFDGVKYTATFVTGGTFSLDGVHPTGRGYAIIANEFIKAINQRYNSNLPLVNPNSYSGVTFP